MNYVVVGVNHKTAPLAVREKLAMDDRRALGLLSSMRDSQGLAEGAVLSTCNRVEVYGVGEDAVDAKSQIKTQLKHLFGEEDVTSYLYEKEDQEVVDHLFLVTSSLDSMVLGENQIVGQVKQAYTQALESKATGPYLNQLFHKAFYVAKRVRTETKIGQGRVSVGSVAVMLAEKIFGNITDQNITLFGAGEIGETVLQCLKSEDHKASITIVNRTFEKAKFYQDQGLGVARPLEELSQVLLETDILITSVSSDFEGFSAQNVQDLMARRKNRPLFVIDLGVPRNVPAEAGDISDVYLYNVDDLQRIAQKNQEMRQDEIDQARSIITEESQAFYDAISDQLTPTIAELNKKFDAIRQAEVQKSMSRLKHLSEDDLAAIEQLTQSITNKILHDPILLLKKDEDLKTPPVLRVIQKIFRLNDEEDDES